MRIKNSVCWKRDQLAPECRAAASRRAILKHVGNALLVQHRVSGRVAVAVGAFADPAFPPPRASVYDSRRHPWVTLPPGVTAFARDPD